MVGGVGVLRVMAANRGTVVFNVSVHPGIGVGGEAQSEESDRNEMLRHVWPSEVPVTQARSVLRGVTTSTGCGEGIYREMAFAFEGKVGRRPETARINRVSCVARFVQASGGAGF